MRPIGTVSRRENSSSDNKAMFCSSKKCCLVVNISKSGIKRTSYKSRVLVDFNLNLKKCPDCNEDLFISRYNTKTPKKEIK